MMIQQLLFWGAALFLGYTYAGYPLLLVARARFGSQPVAKEDCLPRASILVIAHNEEASICRKIDNLLALDYPPGLLDLVIASDASTDATVRLASAYASDRVQVREFPLHRGKPAVLNALVPGLKGDIAVLMDARQEIDADALKQLLGNFSDASVGAVSGELILSDSQGGVGGVGFYWRYEKLIRRYESLLDSTVGATGAFYAIRRHLFEAIPETTVLDDVLIPMQIVRRGYRVLFEPAAHARDTLSLTPKIEFTRKVRTIAGNYQLLCSQPWLLNPWQNRLWFQYLSHKVFRLFCPVALLLVLVMNLMLLAFVFYRITLLLQLLFYAAATSGNMLAGSAKKHPLLAIPQAFCLLNWCTVAGFYRFARRKQQVTWTQTGNQNDPGRTPR